MVPAASHPALVQVRECRSDQLCDGPGMALLLDADMVRVLASARRQAAVLGHPQVTAAHLLLGVFDQPGAPARRLMLAGLSATPLRARLAEQVTPGLEVPPSSLRLSPGADTALRLALSSTLPPVAAVAFGALQAGDPQVTLALASLGLDAQVLASAVGRPDG
jgi:hypothetical protein